MHFAGQTVFITGAAGGMGLETSRAFARHGATVMLADRDEAAVARAAAEIVAQGGKAFATAIDVGNFESIGAAFEIADQKLGRLDHVVTCAAVITAVKALDQTWSHWHRVLDINLLGHLLRRPAGAEAHDPARQRQASSALPPMPAFAAAVG